jgi:hypothetical protein
MAGSSTRGFFGTGLADPKLLHSRGKMRDFRAYLAPTLAGVWAFLTISSWNREGTF